MEFDPLGYLLKADDPDTLKEAAARLQADPGAAARVERLEAWLRPLAACKDHDPVTPGLFSRTIGAVARVRRRRGGLPRRCRLLGDEPAAGQPRPHAAAAVRVRERRVAVARAGGPAAAR